MNSYDVVIVGSGLGGLACGYMLAKEGKKICILEKNRQIGGNLQIFSRDKVIFDTGVHYIGGLDEGQNLNQFFKYFNIMDKLKLKKLDEDGFDRIFFNEDNTEYQFAMGYENHIDKLVEKFPSEKANIKSYCKKLREICQDFPLYNLELANPDYMEKAMPYFNTSATNFIESFTGNRKLQSVLGGTAPLYAGEYNKTPLYIHALTINSYIESAWKCVNGGAQIAKHLVENIKSLGGEVRNYSECRKFYSSGSEIKSVELSTGERVEGKLFISNIHPSVTLDMVEGGGFRKAYVNRIHSLENTTSVFILNLVLEKDSFPYLNYNLYHYNNYNIYYSGKSSDKDWPHFYTLFAPASGNSDEYSDSLSVMVYMDLNEVKDWIDTVNIIPDKRSDRGEKYEEFKREKAEKIINAVSKRFPGIKSKIKSYYTSTPLTYRDYIGTKDGSMYGISRDYRDPFKTFVHSKTRIPNLYFTGQNIHVHGVLGVTIGAILTVSHIVGNDYLLKKIKSV